MKIQLCYIKIMLYDLIIIGGGASGTGAGVYASRRGLKFKIVCEQFGGEVAQSGLIGNYPGMKKTNGIELAKLFREHLEFNQVEIEEGVKIEKIESVKNGLKLIAGTKSFKAKTALIATGAHPRKLKIPGEEELDHKGITYCTTCDGPLFRGKEVVIIGGGNSALEAGMMMAEIAKKVVMVNLNKEFNGETVLVDSLKKKANVDFFYKTQTIEILGEERVSGILVKNLVTNQSQIIKVEGVMVHIGALPNSDPAPVKKNQFNEIIIDAVGRTSNPRIFAAGDVTNHPYKQIAIASGQAVSALLAIVEFLNKI